MKIQPGKGEGASPSEDRSQVQGKPPGKSFSEALEQSKKKAKEEPLAKSKEEAVKQLKQRYQEKQQTEQEAFSKQPKAKASQPPPPPGSKPPGSPPPQSQPPSGAGAQAPNFGQALSHAQKQMGRQQQQGAPEGSKPPPSKPKQKTQQTGQKQQDQAKQGGPSDNKKQKGVKGKEAEPEPTQPQVVQPTVQAPSGIAQAQIAPEAPQAAGGTTPASQIEQIFHANPSMFNSQVQQVTVAQQAGQTTVSVAMANGVQVSVQIAPGGKDLNIQIQGISAAAQAAIDKPENQAFLTSKLTEQGFTIHQIQTIRGEQAAATPLLRPEEREGGGQQQQREQEPEAAEPEEE